MKLDTLFNALADVFDGPLPIEAFARQSLLAHAQDAELNSVGGPLPSDVLDVMSDADAHPVCELIANTPFQWAPPQTSPDPLYVKHSLSKVHVELIGPGGIARSSEARIGLYGMLPNAEYGVRTHPAEEIYVMLAGSVYWKRGNEPYRAHAPYERSYHPSMMEHANKTGDKTFMSIYVWSGDISVDDYIYSGVPT